MDNHFVDFRVRGFKCFKDLKLENLGLVNLIVGDNNVGKTSLLEALLFTEADNFSVIINHWHQIIQEIRRLGKVKEDFMAYYLNREKENWAEHSEMCFDYTHIGGEKRKFPMKFEKKRGTGIYAISIDGVLDDSFLPYTVDREARNSDLSIPYAHFHLGYGADLSKKYAKIQFNDKKRDRLIKALQALIPQINYIEPADIVEGGLSLIIRQDGLPTLPLASFGEGAIKLFRLLMEIAEWGGQRLMIDEIETGIHHKRLIPFWQSVLDMAHGENTQLFATTHSLECLQKFYETLEKPENEHLREKVRVIRLANTAKKGIQAYVHPYENFEYSIENDIEIR